MSTLVLSTKRIYYSALR